MYMCIKYTIHIKSFVLFLALHVCKYMYVYIYISSTQSFLQTVERPNIFDYKKDEANTENFLRNML